MNPPILCECRDTIAFHSTLGKKVCLRPGCSCGGFKEKANEPPPEKETDDLEHSRVTE